MDPSEISGIVAVWIKDIFLVGLGIYGGLKAIKHFKNKNKTPNSKPNTDDK